MSRNLTVIAFLGSLSPGIAVALGGGNTALVEHRARSSNCSDRSRNESTASVDQAQARVACQAQWGHGFHIPSMLGVTALEVFDDGHGPVLAIGGSFEKAWDTWAQAIVGWDGQTWMPFPGALGRYEPTIDDVPAVRAMAVFDDGNGTGLFAAGCFRTAGDVVVNTIAKWRGGEWSALGPGIDDGWPCTSWRWSPKVNALAVFDDGVEAALYAGGDFGSAGGVPASNIARWNGTTWTALGDGVDGNAYALVVFDDGSGPALYCGGEFQAAGGGIANAIARWDGTSWSPLSSGLDHPVYALAVFDDGTGPALYAGGEFTTAGGMPASYIAKWDGAVWSPVGEGLGGVAGVRSLAVFERGGAPALYVAGHFEQAGGTQANRIASWDGTSWLPLGGGIDPLPTGTASVSTMRVFDAGSGARLFVAGTFYSVDGVDAQGMAQWDGTAWSPMDGPAGAGLNDWVFAMTPGDDGTGSGLFVGGRFTRAGSQTLNRIGKWDGVAWSRLGSGMNNQVNGIAFYNDGTGPALYAAGAFTEAGGSPANRTAKWDGVTWTPLGGGLGGTNDTVMTLAAVETGPAAGLYAGGSFGLRVWRWSGSTWVSVGNGTNGSVLTLTPFDDGTGLRLYAGGAFSQAGGVAASRVARWNGSSWSSVGSGLTYNVHRLAIVDTGNGSTLYAGGKNNISRWTGTQWEHIGYTGPGYSTIDGIAGFDDGSGPALFAAGYFSQLNGVTARSIAKLSGSTWLPLTGQLETAVFDLTVFDGGEGPRLIVGGDLRRTGEAVSSNLASWYVPGVCPGNPIPAVSPRGLLLIAVLMVGIGGSVIRRRSTHRASVRAWGTTPSDIPVP